MADRAMVNYGFCCRLCLSEKQDSLKSVFDDVSGGGKLVEEIFTNVGVAISSEDKVTTMVCFQCVNQINNWTAYKKQCKDNQIKLAARPNNWSVNANANVIKDEPADPREHVETVMDDAEPVVVKVEPELDYLDGGDDVPSASTTNSTFLENGFDLEHVANSVRKNSKQCPICNKLFSTAGNRKKHERTIHGLGDAKNSLSAQNSQAEEVESHEESQNSINIQSPAPIQVSEQQRSTPIIEADREKIVFAAGLRLQQRNATPQEIILDSNGLTRIELSYIEKCKAMVTMFDTLVCACHNAVHKNLKRLFSHLRSLKIWFPIFTCYNCMITFTDRSTNMKHRVLCQRKRLEHLLRLSDLTNNDDIKRRLYQIFKCVRCKFLFSFYEDFCDHVDNEHVGEGPPYHCSCMKVFDKLEDYKQHIHRSPCILNYYCDICFVIHSNIDEFETHCKEVHDISEGFVLLQDDNYQQRRHFARGAISPVEVDIVPAKRMRSNEYLPQQIDFEYSSEFSSPDQQTVYNPHAWSKQRPSPCPECGKVYSNYHNMLRHLKTHDESEKTIPCYECGEKFRLHAELKQHNLQVHNHSSSADSSKEYLFSCPDCGDLFHTLQDWNDHKDNHEPQKCSDCDKVFTFKTELEQHRSVHLNLKVYRDSKTHAYRSTMVSPSNIVLMCEICDKTFASKEELKEHKSKHEQMPNLKAENGAKPEKSEDLSKKYSCTICNKHYLGYGGLWDHNKKKHPGRQIAHDYPRKCKYCDKLLYTGGSWVIHKRMHERLMQQEQAAASTSSTTKVQKDASDDDNDSGSYVNCKKCFKVFASKYSLKNHMKSHGINVSPSRTQNKLNKQVWCNICHQPCQGLAELQKHKEEHKNEENLSEVVKEEVPERKVTLFACDTCDQEFTTKVALRKHKESHLNGSETTPVSHRPKNVYCKYCKIAFNHANALADHMLKEHDEVKNVKSKKKEVPKHPCTFCPKVFDTAGALCSHQGWHKRGNVDKHWKVNSDITTKEEEEEEEEEVEVEESDSESEPEASTSKFNCNRCGSSFNNVIALQIHVLEKHRNVNATVVPPRCTSCNVEFESSEAYEKHKQLHLLVEKKKELKQFPCNYCTSAFSRSDTLTAHIKQHHAEFFVRQFKCHVCERVFEKQNALTIHLKVHERHKATGVHPKSLPKGLSCSICQIVFQDSKQLRSHIFAAHPF